MQETQVTQVQFLDLEDPLEKEMETHSSILPENPMDRWACQATVHGIAKGSDTIEQLTKHKDKPRTLGSRIAVLNVTPASGPSTDPCSHTIPQGHH